MSIEKIRQNIEKGIVDIDECKDSQGFYSLQIENNLKWFRTSREQKNKIEKYMKLMSGFILDPETVSVFDKQWILENADLDIFIAPISVWQKNWRGYEKT